MNRRDIKMESIQKRQTQLSVGVRASISIAVGSSWSPCKMTNKMASVLAICQTPSSFWVHFPGFFCATRMQQLLRRGRCAHRSDAFCLKLLLSFLVMFAQLERRHDFRIFGQTTPGQNHLGAKSPPHETQWPRSIARRSHNTMPTHAMHVSQFPVCAPEDSNSAHSKDHNFMR